ncbi:1-acyl-sn-glycerol-3-phosphate acyltransferase [Oligoflexaceae bacterium]|nr:1-acyl-sn-glycerol-3-phosphate acyltransferase [Oligoflexaceae bacterium]
MRRRESLPKKGPAIIIANHNSHLDTMVLMSLFPLRMLKNVRPVAAMDYFMANPLVSWFSSKIIGIVPLARKKSRDDETLDERFATLYEALDDDQIVILFPEGSRGDPETLSTLKTGIAHIASAYPKVDIYPVFFYGLGKVLPKGEALLVPFFCDGWVGSSFRWQGDKSKFMAEMNQKFEELSSEFRRSRGKNQETDEN